MTAEVRDVSTAEFADAVVTRSYQVPVVVDFWAAWCGPCKVLGPILERAAAEAGGEWELVKIDVDQNQQTAMEFGVQGIPTVVGFRDGQPVARFTGALPEDSVRRWLRDLIPSEFDRLAAEGTTALQRGETSEAESRFRSALEGEPDHLKAGVGLATVLLEAGEATEALEMLERLPATEEVRRLQASARTHTGAGDLEALQARMAQVPDDMEARLELGRALAAAGRNRDALERLLEVVAARADGTSERARLAILDLFETIDDEALVAEYRKRLANSLF